MISRYEAWLNDVALSSVDPNILILDIAYPQIMKRFNYLRIGSNDGQFTTDPHIEQTTVSISFQVREYSTARRQEIVQNIIRWAADGWLKTSDRIGQKMYVRCTRPPSVTSVLRWLDTLTIEFTASDYPFWVSEIPLECALSRGETKAWKSASIAALPVSATITAKAALSNAEIICGGTRFQLTGLSIASGGVIQIGYTDDHHILKIEANGASLLDKRTAESSDDLLLAPGTNNVTFNSDASADCVLAAREVYL